MVRKLAFLVVCALAALSPLSAQTKVRLAAIFPGSIQDADYNALGFVAMQSVEKKYKIETAFSERVAVPDAERVLREYVNEGFNVIWVHGNQFNSAADKVADASPATTFIVEGDGKPANAKPNLWYVDRNYYTGFYVLGRLAAVATKSGKVGWLGGLELPFTRGEINAVKQAIKDSGKNVTFEYVYVGDFNDAVKARQGAEGLISKGVDVIISAVNLGNFGIYTAVKEAKQKVFFTTTYTSKKDQAPANYLTADVFDFNVVLAQVLDKIIAGQKGGDIVMDYGKGKARHTDFPLSNVDGAINTQIQKVADDVASGQIKVVKNLATIQ
jgi:basic membrane protein A